MSEITREEAEKNLNELLAELERVEQTPVPKKFERAVDKAINTLESENYEESLEISNNLKKALVVEGEKAKGLIHSITGEKSSKESKSKNEKKVEKVGVFRLSILVAIGGLFGGAVVLGLMRMGLAGFLAGAIFGVIGGFILGLITALLYNNFLKDHISLKVETQRSKSDRSSGI